MKTKARVIAHDIGEVIFAVAVIGIFIFIGTPQGLQRAALMFWLPIVALFAVAGRLLIRKRH